MVRRNKLAFALAVIGAVTIAAHLTLGAAGVMTATQWQSGALIGLVLLAAGGLRAVMAH
ncbi:MAG: hypothetical protein ABSC46_13520 [Candidatus Limnocylindrales bacterium]|jgi:hypothetical protein